MNRATLAWSVAALALAACAPQPTKPVAPPTPAPAAIPAKPAYPAPVSVVPAEKAPADLAAYKAAVANEIWLRNGEVYSDPVPEMLKSIVVLEITIDRVGNPISVSVYRSNGFRHLERRALESIVRAAPFAPPAPGVLDAGSVTFLETFLFRADERFQLRSLVL